MRAVIRRAVPVALVLVAAYEIADWTPLLPTRSLGPFYGMSVQEWFAMVSLPIVAWALWAPTAKLALRVGLLLVLGVVGWGWLLTRPWVGFPIDKLTLYQAYPFIASAVVVLAAVVADLRSHQPSTIDDRPRTRIRMVTGFVALAVAVALSTVWTPGPRVLTTAQESHRPILTLMMALPAGGDVVSLHG